MKKLLLFFAAILVAGSMWGTERSYTISFKDTGNTSDGTTTWSTSSSLSDVFTSTNYVSAITTASNVYPAREGRGAKFGTSKKAGSITFSLTSDGQVTAKRIVLKGGAYINNNTAEAAKVKVNGGSFIQFSQTVTTYTEQDITYTYSTPTDITSISLEQNTASSGRFYIKSITVYYDEPEGSKETATWSASPASIDVYKEATATTTITTNYDGTLTVNTSDNTIATASYNATTKVITVTGVAVGTTNVTITGEETTTYNAISKTIPVTVTLQELTNNKTIDLSGKFSYDYFGLTPSGSDTYAQPDVAELQKTDGLVTMVIKRNGTSYSKPRYDASYLRLYKGNSLTITLPQGWDITSVTFVEPASSKEWKGTMTVAVGEYDNTTKKWIATTNSGNSITFTGKDDTNRIGGIIVKAYNANFLTDITISAAGYSTYYNSTTAYTMPDDCEGYVFTAASGLSRMYEAESVVPAGEPLVIYTIEPGTKVLYSTTSSEDTYKSFGDEYNALYGTDEETQLTADADYYFYGLSLDANSTVGSVGFYWMVAEGAAFKNGAHKAYLKLAKSLFEANHAAPRSFVFGQTDTATDVESVEAAEEVVKFFENGQLLIKKNGVIYNAMGQVIR